MLNFISGQLGPPKSWDVPVPCTRCITHGDFPPAATALHETRYWSTVALLLLLATTSVPYEPALEKSAAFVNTPCSNLQPEDLNVNFLLVSSERVCVFIAELSPPVVVEGVDVHPCSKNMMNNPIVILNMMIILSRVKTYGCKFTSMLGV